VTDAPDGLLVLAGTPIGDPDDAPPALIRELAAADVIAAEDTRRLRRLAAALAANVPGRIVSYFEGNEAARTPELVEALSGGARVLLVTDAGMPSVSDPGYRLVVAAVAAGVRVTAVPGPSAVLTALAVSGLPMDRFCFEGFLPRRSGERSRRLAALRDEDRTMVFFESRHRLVATLDAMVLAFGDDRRAAVCRELTKTHEDVRRGTLGELAAWVRGGVLGEITIVVAGTTTAPALATVENAAALVAEREAAGAPRKEAIAAVAREFGLPKRAVYAAVVARREG
jgi:16S rRNA (cytidine1402-2'-O)-methyltransferase